MNLGIEIFMEDNDILVCRKLAGIPVQTAKPGQQDMVSLLKNYRAGRKEAPEVYVVHRLDQPVEGLMVFAKNQKAAASLSKQIQQKGVDKYYYALVEGIPEPAEGRLEDWLLRDGRTNTSRVVPEGTKDAKKAVLFYKVLRAKTAESEQVQTEKVLSGEARDRETQMKEIQSEGVRNGNVQENGIHSLAEIRLETGRHHQIRVQMAHAGCPLVGDKKYNPSCPGGYLPIGLCSVRLSFTHPTTGKRMEFSIEPLGEAFLKFRQGENAL